MMINKDGRSSTLIKRDTLREKIVEVVRQRILDGTLRPGERINELHLARELDVSRAPLREALWMLSHQGLVHLRSHHGAFVTRLSEKDIREIFEIREILEVHAAKKLRATLTPAKGIALDRALADLEAAAAARDMARFSAADLRFHETLWDLAGNQHLKETLSGISARFFGYELIRDLPRAGEFRFEPMMREHREMVRLIVKGSDSQIEAGYRKTFAAFLDYVLERFGRAATP